MTVVILLRIKNNPHFYDHPLYIYIYFFKNSYLLKEEKHVNDP